MLEDLYVRNLAIIHEVAVELGAGLNVLTGETGAGKSIVVDSLALLAGARASSELIRSGTDELTVTGGFRPAPGPWEEILGQAGLDSGDGRVVIRRQISRGGRNRVFVNDRAVTLGLLAELAPSLLRLHAQREELSLVSSELQRRWLDLSGGDGARELTARVAAAYEEHRALAERWQRLTGDDRLRLERIDLLRFQASEIDGAAVTAGEEERLESERRVLRHAEAIGAALATSLELLFDGDDAAVDRLARSERALGGIADWEPGAAEWGRQLGEARYGLEELNDALRRRAEEVGHDPERLNEIEARLAELDRLFRKFGGSSAEVLARRDEIRRELELLEADEEDRGELEKRLAAALARYRESALELSRARRSWAERLAGAVHRELAELAMKKARFSVRLERPRRQDSPLELDDTPVEIGAAGVDRVVFELAANPGEPPGSLAKIASGGELSRFYLALQLAAGVGAEGGLPVLVFDEVDAGVGGAEAAALGQKLKRLARGGQILAVTHLPQVASFADRHFAVRKRTAGGRTSIAVAPLDREQRVEEVARMLAGRRVTELSRSHAEELIAGAG